MKAVVLDTNELVRDWMLTGLKYQLIEHMSHESWCSFYVPSVVVEELVANHGREVALHLKVSKKQDDKARHLGLVRAKIVAPEFNYRDYLMERFEDWLSFTVLPWPTVPHEHLVRRAVDRRPPFDDKGSGYRDALVWADVLDLVREGQEVALVSSDNAFADRDGQLAPALRTEVEPMKGSVELVRDFNSWLIAQLPWEAIESLPAAVHLSRSSEFYVWYLTSDFQDNLDPDDEDLGFYMAPNSLEVTEVRWDGEFVPVEHPATTDDGLVLIWYDLGQMVSFKAELPPNFEIEPDWRIAAIDSLGRVHIEGTVAMILRVAVLYGGELVFDIEDLSWRRRDRSGQGLSVMGEYDPNQPRLFEM